MPDKQQLTDCKNQIKLSIRRYSDRGFMPYSGCNRVCSEMLSVMHIAECHAKDADYQQAFDIYIMVLLEAVKLISHADTSSGMAGDVIYSCIIEIDKICNARDGEKNKHFFDMIIKTAKNKVFTDWAENGYCLLKSAVHFVKDQKQAQKIYDVFPSLGSMYHGGDYPDKLIITLKIMERLEGKEVADKYLMQNIHVPEVRMIAVENTIVGKEYKLAEKLCTDALKKDKRSSFHKPAPWAYYLERIYVEIGNQEKFTEMVRFILFHGDTSYFKKLKELYQKQGSWEQQRELLWQELSKSMMPHIYASLLAQEDEFFLLLQVVKQNKSYIIDHGKQLAERYPQEAYGIYEEYILDEAKEATDRGKYRKVCKYIKNLAEGCTKAQAIHIIDHLSEGYQRRPAMIEELIGLKNKLSI